MVRVITISDEAYEKLKKLKKNSSFSEVILSLIEKHLQKKYTKKDMLAQIAFLKRKFSGRKRENISEHIDKLLYGDIK